MNNQLKYPGKPEGERAYFEYSPTFGVPRLTPHPKLSPEIVNAYNAEEGVTVKLQVTNWRILVTLATSAMSHVVEICFCDLVAIRASSNWLDPIYGVTLVDNTGLQIHLGATRPHVVANDIWYWASSSVLCGYGSSGNIDLVCQLISSWDIQSLRTPDDYYSLRADQINKTMDVGFSFPIHRPPRFSLTQSMRESANAWYTANESSRNSNSGLSAKGHASYGSAAQASSVSQASVDIVYLPNLQMGEDYRLEKWYVNDGWPVEDSQKLALVFCVNSDYRVYMYAPCSGRVQIAIDEGAPLYVGQELARISRKSELVVSAGASDLCNSVSDLSSTADAIKTGAISIAPGSLPTFIPSVAAAPDSFKTLGTYELDLKYAIDNSPHYFQSFFNDLYPVTAAGIDDDILSAHCFDEGLYAALVKEMHRYTLAEVTANQDEIASKNAGLGAMVGSFLGLITGNIFAPFLGHSYGKNMADRSRRIEEFLPDPNLLFSQDPNSFISWSRGQVSAPRLRRLIFDRHVTAEDQVFFRLVPAIVTGDSVYPIQLFKINSSTYFYRPFAAGIGDADGRKQANYDAIKVQRKYFHIRAEGATEQSPISLRVHGDDIEEYQVKLFRFIGQSLDYFYADFKIQPGSVF
jgi:hypothetical protein